MEYVVGTFFSGSFEGMFTVVSFDEESNTIYTAGLFAKPEQVEDFILRFCDQEED